MATFRRAMCLHAVVDINRKHFASIEVSGHNKNLGTNQKVEYLTEIFFGFGS